MTTDMVMFAITQDTEMVGQIIHHHTLMKIIGAKMANAKAVRMNEHTSFKEYVTVHHVPELLR